jgi:GT2 family glycosyltransferase
MEFMKPLKIAALITCHNRKDKTLLCLDTLNAQASEGGFDIKVYVVDSGSTDGTADAILKRYPEVNLISCDENIYWCGGMRLAWAEAMKGGYDYYLWLNDDTMLYSNAIEILLDTSKKIDGSSQVARSIIVGSTCDPITKQRTYGGYVFNPWQIPVAPKDSRQVCHTMNGNIVLIPKDVFDSIGNISSKFTHAIGDIDYGLRATRKGFSIWLAPGFQGVCEAGRPSLWTLSETPLAKRLRVLHSPKGLPPKEYMIFHKQHNKKWIIAVLKLYLRAFSPRLWQNIKHESN